MFSKYWTLIFVLLLIAACLLGRLSPRPVRRSRSGEQIAKRTWESRKKPETESTERMSPYPLEVAYRDYREFMERNTASIRGLLRSPKVRTYFEEGARTAILPFEEFSRRVDAMPSEQRLRFLRRMSAGHDWALCTWARDDANAFLRRVA